MSIVKELQDLSDKLESKLYAMLGKKTDTELLEYLKEWPEYKRIEDDLKEVFIDTEEKISIQVPIFEPKNLEEENAELISSLTKLKNKIHKKYTN